MKLKIRIQEERLPSVVLQILPPATEECLAPCHVWQASPGSLEHILQEGVVQVLMGISSAPGTLTQGPSNVLGQVKKDSAAVLVVVAEVRGDSRNHKIFRWRQSDDSVLKILYSIHQFFKVVRVEVIRK